MKITGELLKSERTQKNLTVQDVSFSLKLSPKIITAIENGDTDNLPAKTFIRGFVKSYAQFLKIDVDQVMRQFQEEMGSTHPHPLLRSSSSNTSSASTSESSAAPMRTTINSVEPKRAAATAAPTEQTRILTEPKSGRSLAYIGVAVVLVILIVATNRVVDRYQKEGTLDPQDVLAVQPLVPNQQPNSSSAPTTEVATPTSTITATSAAETTTSVSATDPTAPKPANASSEPEPTSQPTQASTTTSVAPTTPQTSNQIANAAVDEGFDPSSGKPVELILEAKKDVEILYARGNAKTFSKLKLSAKQVQVIRSTTGLHLKAEDGSAFHLVVNGIDKGQAGPNNKPIRLSF